MKEKLIIVGRTNWKKGFYIKFKAQESFSVMKKIINEFGSDYFQDNQVVPKTMKYEKWKDEWIPIYSKKFLANVICGDRYIHMIVEKYDNFKSINSVLDKYCEWAKPRYKKGFEPKE